MEGAGGVGDEFPRSSIVLGRFAEQGMTSLSLGIAYRFTIGSDLDAHIPLDSCLACQGRIGWFGVLNYLWQGFTRFLRRCAKCEGQQSWQDQNSLRNTHQFLLLGMTAAKIIRPRTANGKSSKTVLQL